MRFSASQVPLMAPWSRRLSKAYAEQLGSKRHPPIGPNRKVFAGDNVQR